MRYYLINVSVIGLIWGEIHPLPKDRGFLSPVDKNLSEKNKK
jgi:hypothetical protein